MPDGSASPSPPDHRERDEELRIHSPLVRRLAEEFDIDLATIAGTGPDGRVTRDDVHRAAFPDRPLPADALLELADDREPRLPGGAPIPPPLTGPLVSAPDPDPEPPRPAGPIQLHRLRPGPPATPAADRRSAGSSPGSGPTAGRPVGPGIEIRTSGVIPATAPPAAVDRAPVGVRIPLGSGALPARRSGPPRTAVPHQVTSFLDVEAGQLLRARATLSARFGFEIPLDALLIRLALPALDDFPVMNGVVDGDELVLIERRSVAFTCDVGDRSTTAVVADPDRLGLEDLARRVVDLAGRTAGGEPTAAGGDERTFTVSNVGTAGASAAVPVVPAGTTAIVACGRPRGVVRLVEGQLLEVPVLTLTGCFDHRVVDDHQAARFLARYGSYLEDPVTAFAH